MNQELIINNFETRIKYHGINHINQIKILKNHLN